MLSTGTPFIKDRRRGRARKRTREDGKGQCISCERWLARTAFTRDRAIPDGLATRCRKCKYEGVPKQDTTPLKSEAERFAARIDEPIVLELVGDFDALMESVNHRARTEHAIRTGARELPTEEFVVPGNTLALLLLEELAARIARKRMEAA